MLALCFAVAAGAGLIGLALVDPRTVPPVSGTCALILTAAALAAAVLH
ncbi:hypothetical protein [Streptomyces eurythermus]